MKMRIFAFEDINPQADAHLNLSEENFASLERATPEDEAVLGKIALVAAKLARERKLEAATALVNTGSGAG
jgi:histidine triad (HIT) family protein